MAKIKTVKVTAKGLDGFLIETKAGKHISYVDQPEAGGGTDKGPSPLAYVFIALGGCLGTIAKIVAKQQQINLRGFEATIEGDLNLDILMGKDTSERAGFEGIKVHINIDADLSKEEKEKFIEEVDRRCPVSDNLMNITPVELILEQDPRRTSW